MSSEHGATSSFTPFSSVTIWFFTRAHVALWADGVTFCSTTTQIASGEWKLIQSRRVHSRNIRHARMVRHVMSCAIGWSIRLPFSTFLITVSLMNEDANVFDSLCFNWNSYSFCSIVVFIGVRAHTAIVTTCRSVRTVSSARFNLRLFLNVGTPRRVEFGQSRQRTMGWAA